MSKYEFSWKSVHWEPACSMQTDGQDMAKLTVALRNLANSVEASWNCTDLSCYRPTWPRGVQEVKAPRFLDLAHPAAFNPILILIFRGWVEPGLVGCFGKNPQWHDRGSILRHSGAAPRLNHYATPVVCGSRRMLVCVCYARERLCYPQFLHPKVPT